MDKGNPAITNNAFCVLAMKDKHSGFFGGFDVVGPFETEKEASYWGARNISMTPFDNPHWIVAPMTSPKKE